MSNAIGGRVVVCVCLFAGCGGKASSDETTTDNGTTADVADTSAGGEEDPGDGPSTTPMEGTGPSTATNATEDTGPSDDDGVGFVLQPDGGGPANECDPKVQDCEDGQKCTAWANDGGTFWNANKCVDVTGSGVAGDACMVEGSGVSGIDDCDKGYICMNTDQEGLGTCVEFCTGEDEDCDPGNICAIYNDGVLPICLVGCDPLLQDCPEGQACIDTPNARFICFNDASGEIGQDGDACPPADGENSCDPGQWCGPNSAGCTDVNCCTPYCDLSAPACTAPDECVSFFGDPRSAPPGFEDVGVCVLP